MLVMIRITESPMIISVIHLLPRKIYAASSRYRQI